MKILFVSAWFPFPPNNGSKIRTYNIMKELSRDNDVYLASLLQDDSNPAAAEPFCELLATHKLTWFDPTSSGSVKDFLSKRPRSVTDEFIPAMKEDVRKIVADIKPDVIAAVTMGAAEYIPFDAGVPVILDNHNCEFAVLRRNALKHKSPVKRLRYLLGAEKYRRYEVDFCRKCAAIAAVSESDKGMLAKAGVLSDRIFVVPNAVDTEYYEGVKRQPDKNLLLYNGALTYRANRDAALYFAKGIYPLIAEKMPEAVLEITGKTEGVNLEGIKDRPGIRLTGYVDDIREELAKAAVCVVPLREGGGSRLKILEAMAAGVPVVSTSVGAEGIEVTRGKNILIADTPKDFAEAVISLTNNDTLADNLAKAAKEFVSTNYSRKRLGDGFAGIIKSVTGVQK